MANVFGFPVLSSFADLVHVYLAVIIILQAIAHRASTEPNFVNEVVWVGLRTFFGSGHEHVNERFCSPALLEDWEHSCVRVFLDVQDLFGPARIEILVNHD